MKKRILSLICICCIVLLSACSKNSNNINEVSDDADVDTEVEEQADIDSLEGNVIIDDDTVLIKSTRGYVRGMGSNDDGSLGLGNRLPVEDWTTIPDLSGVTGIWADYQYKYALTEDGELYYWGSNILSPQKIDFWGDKVTSVEGSSQSCLVSEYLIIRLKNKKCYLVDSKHITELEGFDNCKISHEKIICENNAYEILPLDYDNMNENEEGDFYMSSSSCNIKGELIAENASSYCGYDCEQEYYSIYDMAYGRDEVVNYNHYYLAADGSVVMVYDNGEGKKAENIGGSGIKKFYRYGTDKDNDDYFELYLFEGGSVKGRGSNEYGQLGDGTTLDYYDDALTVSVDNTFIDLAVDLGGYYCRVIALDDEGNIWAWGSGHSLSPEIYIPSEVLTFFGQE